jgi:hypothetical protein
MQKLGDDVTVFLLGLIVFLVIALFFEYLAKKFEWE